MRTKVVRTVQGLLAIGGLFVLTGANGGGCGGGGSDDGNDDDGSGGASLECPPGSHNETVCDPNNVFCWEECVPDQEGCPPDTILQYECPDVPTDCGDPSQQDCGGECYPVCVPISPCGPDSHEEWICNEPAYPMESCDEPPPGCYPICVPNDQCGPGMHEEWVCEDNPMLPDDPMGNCYPICVPDPVCQPGFHEEIVCSDPMDPNGDPMIPEGECIVTCVPDQVCAPGFHEEIVCEPVEGDPMGGNMGDYCYTTCVPDEVMCPPETMPVQVCVDDGMGGVTCWIECYFEQPME